MISKIGQDRYDMVQARRRHDRIDRKLIELYLKQKISELDD